MSKMLMEEGAAEKVEPGFEKLKCLELIIIPKKKFLDWYRYMRGQIEEVE